MAPVVIGARATLGLAVTVMGDVEVGAEATVLPNSVLLPGSRVGPGETWGGVPARRITREEMERVQGRNPGDAAPMSTVMLAPELEERLAELREAGWELFDKFDHEVRDRRWHPFVAANYESVLEALIAQRAPGLTFLEWGSATGVITIMADLLGYEAYGIELDASLVETARALARNVSTRRRASWPAASSPRATSGSRATATAGSAPSGRAVQGTSSSAAPSTTSTSCSGIPGRARRR